MLEALEPDVLLLGGDFVSVRAADIHRLAPEFAKVNAPFGKFAVPGNHDLRANFPEVVAALNEAGVTVLRNSRATLAVRSRTCTSAGSTTRRAELLAPISPSTVPRGREWS